MVRTSSNRGQTWARAGLLAALVLYLALTLPQLALPGLHYDEANEAGVNALEMIQGQDVHAFRAAGVQVGHAFLPLMVQDYIGALNVFLALPPLALLGITVPALRLVGVFCGLLTLLLVWALGQELARQSGDDPTRPRLAGVIAALLLAASPSFVFWSRQGIFVTNVVVTLAAALALLAARWRRTRRPRHLYALALVAGLGLWSKLLFVWVLGALGAVAAVLALRSWSRREPQLARPRSRPREVLAAAGLFVLALGPLILFNQQTQGTLRSIFGNLGQSYYGVQNADFGVNLAVRLGQLVTLLRGDHLWYLGGVYANRAAPFIAAGLLLAALAVAAARGRAGRETVAALLLGAAFVALLVLQSCFTVSDLFITHYAIVQPFVVMLAALAAGSLLMPGRWRWLRVAAVVALLAGWAGVDAANSVRYHQALARSGGLASHSDAIERLASWLDERGIAQPVAMDWGFAAQLRFLTANRVQPLEVYGFERLDAPDPGFEGRVEPLVNDPTRRYIVRMPEGEVFHGRREALQALLAGQGKALKIDEAFYDRSGTVMFVVLRVDNP